MKIVDKNITLDELKEMSKNMHESLVKAVVDIEQNSMVIDADMHADEEAFLLEQGSQQENLWGINIHPYKVEDEWIEFDSMINIRPGQGNRSRGIDDTRIQEKIKKIVYSLVTK